MEVGNDAINILVLRSFRYALGRRSYFVGETIAAIWSVRDNLPDDTKKLIVQEIRAAIADNKAGDNVDAAQWAALAALLDPA